MNALVAQLLTVLLTLLFASRLAAEVTMQTIEYKAGDTNLKGYAAWNPQLKGKLPVVLIVHEWWGNNQYSKDRALQLAEMGYLAFAIDMYGDGKTTDDPKQAEAWMTATRSKMATVTERIRAACDRAKSLPQADPDRMGAIGYCFGGMIVLEMARQHLPVKAVVSFHGGLLTDNPEATRDVTAKILVCNGQADVWVPQSEIDTFKKEMATAKADLTFINYPDAQHAFTNPVADSRKIEGVKYNAAADKKSWEDMTQFFNKHLRQ